MASIADGPLTSLAFCWRLQRPDGAGIGLTSGDRDVMHDGITYRAAPGATPAVITRSLGLEPNSGEIAGALSADALTEADLALFRWEGCKVQLFAIDWTIPDSEKFDLLAGELGEVSLDDDSYSAELVGAAARLEGPVCPSTSPECRAAFGDKQCRVDLAGRTLRAGIVSCQDNLISIDRPIDGRFLFGRFRYLGGRNCGLESRILGVEGSALTLRDRPRAPVQPGTQVELREGCDKRFETCVSRFGNAANFRGEPHLPGTDLLTRYPGA